MEEMELPARPALWFEEWFNSPYYHLLYKNRNEEEAQFFINNLLSKLNLNKGAKILDLACGKGRHAVYLNSLGYDVTGIDLSEENISIAKQSENETLAFFEHDMRHLYWSDYFDCIMNLFTSFGYFDDESDNVKTLQSVHDSLKPGGTFVIDFLNADKLKNELVAAEIITREGVEFHISREVKDDYIFKTIEVKEGEKSKTFTEKVHLLHLENFEKYFAETGLKIMGEFGDYSLNTFDAAISERLIIVVEK